VRCLVGVVLVRHPPVTRTLLDWTYVKNEGRQIGADRGRGRWARHAQRIEWGQDVLGAVDTLAGPDERMFAHAFR
jgi:hypothetical protein